MFITSFVLGSVVFNSNIFNKILKNISAVVEFISFLVYCDLSKNKFIF